MIQAKKLTELLLLGALSTTGCGTLSSPAAMIKPPISSTAASLSDEKAVLVVNNFLPKDARIVNPKNPEGDKGIQLADINGDGKDEIIVLYKLSGEQAGAGLLVLSQISEGSWNKLLDYKSEGFGVNYFKLTDVTGDKKPDIVVGWTIGAIANGLDIFSSENNELKKIASDYYSKIEAQDMPDKNGTTDGISEIALWKHDTGEAYKTDVLKWNGEKLVSDPDVYPYYFKKVAQYYEQKVKEMPEAAFYWYYLADAQIKSTNPKDALSSIKTGLSITEKHPDYYPGSSEFLKLKKIAEGMLPNKQ